MKKSPDRALANASLSFPKNTMTGSIGDLAKLLSAEPRCLRNFTS